MKLAFEKDSCRKVAVKIIEKKTFSMGGTVKKVNTLSVPRKAGRQEKENTKFVGNMSEMFAGLW